MISRYLVCILISLITAFNVDFAFAKNDQPSDIFLPAESLSYNSPFSMIINPVYADFSDEVSIFYKYNRYKKLSTGNNILGTTLLGFTFTYAWLNCLYRSDFEQKIDGNYFSIYKGFMLSNWFGFGFGYLNYKMMNDEVKTYLYNIAIQPSSLLSFSYMVDHVNEPEFLNSKLKKRQWFSVSLRAFDKYLTFSWDIKKYEKQSWSEADNLFTLSGYFIKDIMWQFQYNKDSKDYQFSINIPLDGSTSRPSTIIYSGGYSTEGIYAGGIKVTDIKFVNPIQITSRYLYVRLYDNIEEIKQFKVFGNQNISFFELVRSLREANYDNSIKGVIIEIDGPYISFSQAQEIISEIRRLQKNGKNVYCLLNSMGNIEYYIAAQCKYIYMNPTISFSLTGIKAEVYFFKDLLDKVGIKFEEIKKGEYKSFAESFTRSNMSKPFKENMESIVNDLYRQFINDISDARLISKGELKKIIDKGIITVEEAKKKGLINDTGYLNDLIKRISKINREKVYLVNCENYIEENMHIYDWGPRPKIAIIFVNGNIVQGEVEDNGFVRTNAIGNINYRDYLIKAFKDKNIKAIVIRINSGGGSAVASDLMWKTLLDLKIKYKKPVVFSFGNIAASGGYYIACTRDTIFSNKSTITGSIGVIFGKLNFEQLYAKLGINKEIIKKGEFADILSESKSLSKEEKDILQNSINNTYRIFLKRVSYGRKLSLTDVEKIAKGKVYTGNQAIKNGLVDKEGGLLSAIAFAKLRANIKGEFQVAQYPQQDMILKKILKAGAFQAELNSLIEYFYGLAIFNRLENDEVLYWFPAKIEIK